MYTFTNTQRPTRLKFGFDFKGFSFLFLAMEPSVSRVGGRLVFFFFFSSEHGSLRWHGGRIDPPPHLSPWGGGLAIASIVPLPVPALSGESLELVSGRAAF